MLEKFLSKKRAQIADKLISPYHRNGRILDIGCGEFPYFLINTRFNEKYGIDRIGENAGFRDKDGQDICIKSYDIEKEGLKLFEDAYFDTVTMLAVMEHFEPRSMPYIIKEIKRVLKPEGVLIFTTPAPWTRMILELLSRLRLISRRMIQEHKALYNKKGICLMLKDCGFLEEKMRFGTFEFFMNTW